MKFSNQQSRNRVSQKQPVSVRNIFLTGDLHVGKSTIVRNILRDLNLSEIGGYRTEPIFESENKVGFKMISFSGEEKIFAHENFTEGKRFGNFRVQMEIFNNFGAETLTAALARSRLIVIDEIGAMEKEAKEFQMAISRCLDSPIPVLGVFQQRAEWIEAILKSRDDVVIFSVDRENRAIVQDSVLNVMRSLGL